MTVVNFLLLSYYDWDFEAANPAENTVPRWVWSVAALNILIYYNLGKLCVRVLWNIALLTNALLTDGMDGKQARRTGTSGPLGELFDHGLDSYSAVLIPIYMFSLFGSDDLPPIRMFFVIWNVFLNFYLTHVEKYNTGVMFLPWGYDFTMWVGRTTQIWCFHPTDIMFFALFKGVSITLFLTTIIGPGIWRARTIFNLSMANVFEIILIGSGIVTSHPIIIKNIYM